MTNYFVRIGGSDAAAGTSAGAAWRTINKALSAAGIASGDTVYIGAGIYRETVTVAMTSATVETSVIGDNSGEFTGDAGEIIWTTYLNGWNDTPSNNDVLNLAGRDFLTFRNLHLVSAGTGNCVDGNTVHSSDIKFDNCVIQGLGSAAMSATATFALALNWTIQRCIIDSLNAAFTITLTTGVGADYDANVQIIDSALFCNTTSGSIVIVNSGTAANEGGGVDILRCHFRGPTAFTTSGTRISLTFPCTFQDCVMINNASVTSGEAGALLDLGGNVATGSFTNVTLHATSKTTTEDFPAPLLSFAHEWMWGMQPRRFMAPMFPDVLNRGTIGTATTDMEGRARPEGIGRLIDSGTATAGAATTITDGGKAWRTDEFKGKLVRTTGGTGSGQVKHISSNTATSNRPH